MAIPSKKEEVFENNGVIKTMHFDLSDNPDDRKAMIELLRSKIYSDKILAVIREYSTNASDANVEAGRGNDPITISLPTRLSQEFRVKDTGFGLTPEEIDLFMSQNLVKELANGVIDNKKEKMFTLISGIIVGALIASLIIVLIYTQKINEIYSELAKNSVNFIEI